MTLKEFKQNQYKEVLSKFPYWNNKINPITGFKDSKHKDNTKLKHRKRAN